MLHELTDSNNHYKLIRINNIIIYLFKIVSLTLTNTNYFIVIYK